MTRLALLLAAFALAGSPAASQGLHDTLSGCGGVPPERTFNADPFNYLTVLATLGPGDRMLLSAGTYAQGLPFMSVSGQPNRCIVVEGPSSGPTALFTGSDTRNTISLRNSSYLAIRNLELDGLGLAGDGVKAEGDAQFTHHVLLERLTIRGHGANQQIVGISTKCPSWNWVIRKCTIDRAGTGLYLGNSDGSAEFVNGLVEYNLITDTIGYNAQIKHQLGRATGLGIPANATTIIRHNVFSKANNASTGGNARPNLLVGHWPLTGPGSTDVYQIHGNFFFQNPVEALFQGEGNVALYENLFLNDGGPAVAIQFQNSNPRAIDVFYNTVVSSDRGIRISGADTSYVQRVAANAVFSALPISGGTQTQNVYDAYANRASYLVNPTGTVGSTLDFYPRVGTLTGPAVDTTGLTGFLDWSRDFNGVVQPGTFRGAYAAEGTNPGWRLDLTIKPEVPVSPPPTRLYTVTPCRVADTRDPDGPRGGPALGASTTRAFPVTGTCNVPTTARSVAFNVTVVAPAAPGDLRLFATGQPSPESSVVNFAAGAARANNAIIPLGISGRVSVQCDMPSGSTHLILDVVGYFQ